MRCDHGVGVVALVPSQTFVRIRNGRHGAGHPILLRPDPVGRPLSPPCKPPPPFSDGKPCTMTMNQTAGWSPFVFINDGSGPRSICRDDTAGLTDSSDPGTHYRTRSPGQDLVREVGP